LPRVRGILPGFGLIWAAGPGRQMDAGHDGRCHKTVSTIYAIIGSSKLLPIVAANTTKRTIAAARKAA